MKRPPPWLFVLTGTPYGVVASFVGQVMPYMSDRAHIEMSAIGWYSALLYIPAILVFTYAPIIDIGPRRKHWLVLLSLVGAACLLATFMVRLPDQITAFLVFAFAANLISGLVGSCNGALMATSMPDELRGKASGWYNVGNLSGGGLSASITIWMLAHDVDRVIVGAAVLAMMVAPSLAVLWLDEPPRPQVTVRGAFRTALGDVGKVLFSRLGFTGIALCLSPVGTAALVNFFSGMGSAYGANANSVALVNGLVYAGMSAIGAGAFGYLCDRYNRRVLYLVSGLLTALCGIAMALSPRAELTYLIGVSTYALITGFCNSTFTSTVLETIGVAGLAAATQYSLFVAAGNTAITYVGFIDTRFEASFGVEGVVAADAALNVLGVVVLALAFWRLGAFGKWRHAKPELAPPDDKPAVPAARVIRKDPP